MGTQTFVDALQRYSCLVCSKTLDAAVGPGKPDVGAVSVCAYCSNAAIFGEKGLEPLDLSTLGPEDRAGIEQAQRLVAQVRRNLGRERAP